MSLESVAPNYLRARDRWPEASMLATYYDRLDECVAGTGAGLLESVKSYVECVCLTVLNESGRASEKDKPSTTELFLAALQALGVEHPRRPAPLGTLLSGFSKIADGLNAIRNSEGYLAHGKDAYYEAIAVDHARAYLHAGDIMIGTILGALEGRAPDLKYTRDPYENFRWHHDRIDSSISVQVEVESEAEPVIVLRVATGAALDPIELRLEPSRVLFGVDRDAYLEVLKAVGGGVPELAETEAVSRASIAPTEAPVGPPGPVAIFSSEYVGELGAVRDGVADLLGDCATATRRRDGVTERLLDSVLATAEANAAVDWRMRVSVESRMEVGIKRVLAGFGVPRAEADRGANRVVELLRSSRFLGGEPTDAPPPGGDGRARGA